MSDRSFDLDELRVLLDAVCDETITAEQMQRLEQLILAHPEAEAHYVQYMSLQADLGRVTLGPDVVAPPAGRSASSDPGA